MPLPRKGKISDLKPDDPTQRLLFKMAYDCRIKLPKRDLPDFPLIEPHCEIIEPPLILHFKNESIIVSPFKNTDSITVELLKPAYDAVTSLHNLSLSDYESYVKEKIESIRNHSSLIALRLMLRLSNWISKLIPHVV